MDICVPNNIFSCKFTYTLTLAKLRYYPTLNFYPTQYIFTSHILTNALARYNYTLHVFNLNFKFNDFRFWNVLRTFY